MINRIKEVIALSGLSDRAFAIKCGIKQNTLSRQLGGVSEVSASTINAILDNYEEISAESVSYTHLTLPTTERV